MKIQTEQIHMAFGPITSCFSVERDFTSEMMSKKQVLQMIYQNLLISGEVLLPSLVITWSQET